MITNLLNKTSKLDRAIVVSVAAMLAFNVLALTSQVQPAPAIAQIAGNAAGQA